MARCPACRRSFAVPEDEHPAEHGCPSCGYGTDGPEPVCPSCAGTGCLTDEHGTLHDDVCPTCEGGD